MWKKRFALVALTLVLGLAGSAHSQQALNLQSADIRAFIQDVARVTGRTFIIDPRVQGTVTIASDGPLAPDELIEVLMSTLRANGLIAVPAGGNAFRVMPDASAAQQPPTSGEAGNVFATEIFQLNAIDAAAAVEALRPLVGPQGVIQATPGNVLVIADYADNLRRIRALISRIDLDQTAIRAVTLRNSSAREIIQVVNQLLAPPGQQGAARSTRLSMAPVESSNSIVLRGEPLFVEQVVAIVADLDERAASTDDVRVVRLQHANAANLLPVLQQLVGQTPTPPPTAANGENGNAPAAAAPATAAPPPAQAATPSGRRANIALFESANALVINAEPETQRILADVIRQLDVRREQVLVEAIVVEVSDDTAKQLGVQFLLAGNDKSAAPFFATNYSNSAPNLLALTGAIAGENVLGEDSGVLEDLRNAAVASLIGANGALLGIGGQANDALFGLIVNAVKSDQASNLLSTPSVLTLDNEEASLLVGQEVPITTGEVLGDANTNPFRTVQRQDVGIQLEVKPQINAGGAITLLLRQEVSSIAGPASASVGELVLNKREITTTVLVDDGDIVVLGGLLDQNDQLIVDKVPGLGDIPMLGNLFRSTDLQRNKRNLMVFIRPTIVRNPDDAQSITVPRYEYMRAREIEANGTSALEQAVRDYMRASEPVAGAAAP
jgi:general secretion pathway protein D